MRKFLSLITVLTLSSVSTLSSISCDLRNYFDDRTPIQLKDAEFILSSDLKFNLNSNKHVLLIGVDGVPFANLRDEMIDASAFVANFYNQAYETVKGWISVLWGNILRKEKTIFNIIKENDSNLTTANIIQWMDLYYYNKIYDTATNRDIDYHVNFTDEAPIENYNTVEKIQARIENLKNETQAKIDENYNFIFAYNDYYDSLKHSHYLDDSSLILALIEAYSDLLTYFYNTLNPEEWLIIMTTDHGREDTYHNFGHPDVLSSHFSWTLANNSLDGVLGHAFSNFYDIRTSVIKWLMK